MPIDVCVFIKRFLFVVIREGVFQPCTVGEDGKPKPVEHVSQLLAGAEGGAEALDSDWFNGCVHECTKKWVCFLCD